MRKGVLDVLPASAIEGLTSEDLRLLLNGVGEVQVSSLVAFTSFHDESSEGGEKLARFRRWFWSVVERMTNAERQDLVSRRFSTIFNLNLLKFDNFVINFSFCLGLLLDRKPCAPSKRRRVPTDA